LFSPAIPPMIGLTVSLFSVIRGIVVVTVCFKGAE
jgi:hypothetical protein